MRLERLGIPTVTLVLDAFESAARTHARIHGNPNLPIIVVPRDFLDEPDDERIVERDQPIFDAIVRSVTL